MKTSIIRKSDLTLAVSEKLMVGGYLYDRERLYQISAIKEDGGVIVDEINPITLEVTKDGYYKDYHISKSSLEEYYKVLGADAVEIKALAERVLNGETIEEFTESDDTALMSLNNKETLLALKDDISKACAVAEKTRKYAELIMQQQIKDLKARMQPIQDMVKKMKNEVKRLDYVIQTIETYMGIKEDLIRLQKGEPSSETTPIVFRQAVIFMDEEMALIDDDFDWQKSDRFDKWLLEDNHYKDLMPDEKSMVALKPRRTDKLYTDGNTASDRLYNWMMNENNHQTVFLVRNGENLYKIESEHIILTDRMFPNKDEYENILKAESAERGNVIRHNQMESETFRKRYTQVAFLMQGLIDRSDVFSPHNVKGSFLNLEGIEDGQICLRYELDLSHALGDGRLPIKDWLRKVNSTLCEGKRIVLIPKQFGLEYGYEFDKDCDFIKYYSNKFSTPSIPTEGIYTLEAIGEEQKKGYYKTYDYAIKYKPKDDYYWYHSRKNRVSIRVQVKSQYNDTIYGVLNYDDVNMDDIEYYLNSRLHRSQYFRFVRLLKKVKDLYLKERVAEDEYIKMFVGQIMARGLKAKGGYVLEEVVRVAIETVKNRLKWKRPITAKEKETYTLVERTLFSKSFVDKYFV